MLVVKSNPQLPSSVLLENLIFGAEYLFLTSKGMAVVVTSHSVADMENSSLM